MALLKENKDKLAEMPKKSANKVKIGKIKKYAVLSAFGLLLLFSAYHACFANKIIPGVRVGTIKLGGQTSAEALKTLQSKIEEEQTLILKDSDKDTIYEIKTQEIELKYDLEDTVRNAFSIGRTGNLWIDNKNKLAGLVKPLRAKASVDFNAKLLEQRLSQIKGMVDQPAQDAKFYFDEDEELRIQNDRDGRKINSGKLYNTIIVSFVNFSFGEKDLPISQDQAKIVKADLENVEPQIAKLLENDLTVTHKDKAWEIDAKEKLIYISVSKENSNTQLKLNTQTFESYIEKLSKEINVLPRGKVLQESDSGQVIDFELTETGEELDVKTFTEDFKEALFNGKETVIAETVPTDNSSDLTKYGIFALLGYGESIYSGSSSARIHNLTLAAERASGVLVPPGETYSLSRAVGPINANTGYNSAWIISNGRTVLGSGGGVCQTSTTLFRAALDSGLPITERHAHAYRVYYYEKDQPVGFDAAIYQPALDLKFKNDSPNYILVQSQNHPDESKLSFKIYGTPDGRKVTITDPDIYGVSPAPAPLYEETDELPKGTTKQIDFAAPGGTSVFSRIVKKDGETLFEETYKSVYRPWRAVYLVGTGT